nr:immunoglobulin light chain junction region [Macaca mulatta]MOV95184.1 immunoglobulin light chain junction region [Macaca mulatta]MOV96754.1 immunoglobulin light chain junction region [Macaca mulatta]MOV97097.1 immunoglobulin light chain junction region [Macaca mulatta]MOV97783.1 immunoglobulin light chain junction region [Macaca mulatta]
DYYCGSYRSGTTYIF